MRANRSFNCRAVVACLIASAMTLAPAQRDPLLLFNRSPSLPTGWYTHRGNEGRRGEFVVLVAIASVVLCTAAGRFGARSFDEARACRARRFVSTLHNELRVDGVRIGAIAAVDPAGRAIPHWIAKRSLCGDELLVGSTESHSLDSRYFDQIRANQVIGVYRKLTLRFALIQSRQSDLVNDSHWLFRSPQRDSVTNSRWSSQSPSIGRCAVDGLLGFQNQLLVGKRSNDLGQGKGRLLTLRVTVASIGS